LNVSQVHNTKSSNNLQTDETEQELQENNAGVPQGAWPVMWFKFKLTNLTEKCGINCN